MQDHTSMFTVLSTRRLFFDSTPERLVALASQFGFDGVEPVPAHFLATDHRAGAERVQQAGLRWGPASLPSSLGTTASDEAFDELLETLSLFVPRLAAAGVSTMCTWIAPANDESDFATTWALHVDRLNRIEPILAESGLRFALEYVGPATWRADRRYEFVHTLAGTRELIGSLANPSTFGVLLDTIHWYTAGETPADIAGLTAQEVLAVDLNDAPLGRARDEQWDMQRTLPGATGVIDSAGFVGALRTIGFAGPVQSEPYSDELRTQPEEQRVRESADALRTVLGGMSR